MINFSLYLYINLVAQPVQHVIHHHVQSPATNTCPGYCELCCPWTTEPPPPAKPQECHCRHRQSRRDSYEREEFEEPSSSIYETIDQKIERIRRELRDNSSPKHDKATVTDSFEHHIHPRPRSSSRPRSASGIRDPWRPSNQNDYPWRDSHLPAYREATLARSQTPANDRRIWKETAHERSHENTKYSTSYCSKKDYVYRPKSEVETRKWYTQSTGKDPDREVYQALRGGTTTYAYSDPPKPSYNKYQSNSYEYTSNTVIPKSKTNTTVKTHALRKIDSTQHHNLYACSEPCLHIVPKTGQTADPPYLKILNAPVTYLH